MWVGGGTQCPDFVNPQWGWGSAHISQIVGRGTHISTLKIKTNIPDSYLMRDTM